MSEELTSTQEAQIPASVATETAEAATIAETAAPAVEVAAPAAEAPAEEATPAAEAPVPAPAAEPAPEAPKAEVQVKVQEPVAKKPFPGKKFGKKARPQVSDADRKEMWKNDLRKIGGYTDEGFITAVVDYAMKNHGYNADRRWGGCLKVMVNRVAQKCRDSLRSFTPADVQHIIHEIERFLMEKPLGGNAQKWNEGRDNAKQRELISEFFGINCAFRQMKPENVCMTAIRDAAWPTIDEEKKGTGGSFAERFHYLAMCIIRLCTTSEELQEGMFGGLYHSQPSETFLQRIGGGNGGQRRERRDAKPGWITPEGICSECQSAVVKDEDGNLVCSNALCDHSIPTVSVRYEDRPRKTPQNWNPGVPPSVPQGPGGDDRPKRNWKGKKDRRHDHDEGEFPKGGKKHHGKRWHQNDDDFEGNDGAPAPAASEGRTIASYGGEMQNNAFAALDGLKLPEPPAEQPVV